MAERTKGWGGAEVCWGGGPEEKRIQFRPLPLSRQRCGTPTSPRLFGNTSCFCWGADSRLTPAVHAATLWPWGEEVKWSLWTPSSELSVPSLTCPRGLWQSWKSSCRWRSRIFCCLLHAKCSRHQENVKILVCFVSICEEVATFKLVFQSTRQIFY